MSEAPERIWACMDGPMVGLFVSGGYNAGWPEYVRADLFDAGKAERDNYKALYEAERDDELLNIARQAGYQDGAEERRKLEARVTALTAALSVADYALLEAEAILGGEYSDHYQPLCDTMTDLRNKISALQENTDASR